MSSGISTPPTSAEPNLLDPLLARLASLSTCDVSDGLLKLGIASGGFIPDLHAYSPCNSAKSLVAPAYTVQLVHGNDASAPKPPVHFVDACPKGSFIIIRAPVNESGGPLRNACWGGLMTLGAKTRNAAGVVIVGGGVRDLREHRAEQFPVYASYHSTLPQSPFTRPSSLQVPLRIPLPHQPSEPLTINPGDWIMADEDGVVCIPLTVDLTKLVADAEERARVDGLCAEDLRSGKGVAETFKARRG